MLENNGGEKRRAKVRKNNIPQKKSIYWSMQYYINGMCKYLISLILCEPRKNRPEMERN